MIYDRVLCEASEKAKIVANKCLSLGYSVTTLKLEKLLILMHGMMLSKYHRPLFSQSVVILEYGPLIREVDSDLLMYSYKCDERLVEYVCLLEHEEEVMDEIIDKYGMLYAFNLNNLRTLKILSEICYEDGKVNIVPNYLIEATFDYYKFYDLPIVKKNEENYKKRLKLRYQCRKNVGYEKRY